MKIESEMVHGETERIEIIDGLEVYESSSMAVSAVPADSSTGAQPVLTVVSETKSRPNIIVSSPPWTNRLGEQFYDIFQVVLRTPLRGQ